MHTFLRYLRVAVIATAGLALANEANAGGCANGQCFGVGYGPGYNAPCNNSRHYHPTMEPGCCTFPPSWTYHVWRGYECERPAWWYHGRDRHYKCCP